MITIVNIFKKWADSNYFDHLYIQDFPEKIDLMRILPLILIHIVPFFIIFVGFSKFCIYLFLVLYTIQMFAITAINHRYFSHHTYKINRIWQFIFAFWATTTMQRNPIWWASHHRYHHANSDKITDPHSPVKSTFLNAHIFWFIKNKNYPTKKILVKYLLKFPELRLIERYDVIPPIIYALLIFILGVIIEKFFPELKTSKWQVFIVGFFLVNVIVLHITLSINSLGHLWGKKSYFTNDNSRNNFLLAIFTLGEGWHNNHHFCPSSCKQGFKWWQIDISYYLLQILEKLRIIKDIKKIPKWLKY